MTRAKLWVLLVSTFLLAGCGAAVQKGLKPSSDWSRGVPVGFAVDGSPGLALETAGEQILLVWPEHTIERTLIHFQRMDKDAVPFAQQTLDLLSGRIRSPRLLSASNGRFHLLFARRPPQESFWELWYALLDQGGSLVTGPTELTAEDMNLGSYDLVEDTGGSVYIVCDCGRQGGIYAMRLDGEGRTVSPLIRLAASGESPSARLDQRGDLHVAWADGRRLLYARLAGAALAEVAGEEVTSMPPGTGANVIGPRLGLSHGWVYLFWSVLNRSGLQSGSAYTAYVAFPEDDLNAATTPARILILPDEDQPYQEGYSGTFSITQLVQPLSVSTSTDFVYEPMPIQGELSELAIAIAARQDYRQDTQIQIVVVLFDAGRIEGYQIAGRTLSISSDPILLADGDGNLHLTWREGADGDRVFYATTAPETRAALDRIRLEDIVNTLLRGGLEGFATILLFPLALPWLVPGFLLLGVWKITRDRESLAFVSSWVMLVAALGFYQVTKLLFLPTILTYVPFSAWMDIPAGWAEPLRVGVPIFIILAGLGVAELGRRRSEATLLYYVLFVLTDMVLTLGVYGVNLLGVF